ncbi:DUF3540 domain-containing protein [Ciceribacter sp. L1K22]|uniref:DUF3540 domain-containing protein n=1 Tax=Ciceribacter sp. L1K22 TaxID=2820275 RepID=UPI001ABE0316|nr:DUF3540 domain-containing protein [Ciceribacter sp. L1K22]MBO3761702.1 DUF3540 domain-containing protein [Ciceribacter sp. L1K22]
MSKNERLLIVERAIEERIGEAAVSAVENGMLRATVRAFVTTSEAILETDAGDSLVARQAASCLLAPAMGDRVLVHVGDRDAFILAVLERQSERVAELGVPGATDAVLQVAGRLGVKAATISLAAPRVELMARALLQAGESLTSNFRRITETVVDKIVGARTVTTTAQSRTTAVREVDVLEAGSLVQTISSVVTQNSEIALITAKRDVRLDGERVSVG